QSDVFIGVYWQRYGELVPGERVSGLEEEFDLSGGLPRLLYVKGPAPDREPRLASGERFIRLRAAPHLRYPVTTIRLWTAACVPSSTGHLKRPERARDEGTGAGRRRRRWSLPATATRTRTRRRGGRRRRWSARCRRSAGSPRGGGGFAAGSSPRPGGRARARRGRV